MPVTDDAINEIKSLILAGVLRPGDRLPRESDMAESLGLSRSSLREAVRALVLIRVLDVRQGDGTYVTSLEPELLLKTLNFVIDFQQDHSVLDFLRVRQYLESVAAGLAARNISSEQGGELRLLLSEITSESTVNALVDNDLRFHRRIAQAAGNPVLVSLLDIVSGPTTRARVWRVLTQEGAHQRTLDEHAAIVDALERGDDRLAAARVVVHISGVEEWLRAAIPDRASRDLRTASGQAESPEGSNPWSASR